MAQGEALPGQQAQDQPLASVEAFAVEVIYCPQPGQVDLVSLQCQPGCTLMQAVQRSGLLQRHAELERWIPGPFLAKDSLATDLQAQAMQDQGTQDGGMQAGAIQAGIWGKKQPLDTPLRAQDRVELYRPLTVDPKEARRLRYRKQRQDRSAPAKHPAAPAG